VLSAGFQHLRIDENIVAADIGMERGDVADSAHVGGKVVNLIDAATCGKQAVLVLAQIENLKLIAGAGFILGILDIGPPDPMAIRFQPFDQMMSDETARARY